MTFIKSSFQSLTSFIQTPSSSSVSPTEPFTMSESKPYIQSVIYPTATDGTTFNLEYYLDKHIPLVTAKWTPHGLLGYRVYTYEAGPGGSKPDFTLHCILEWKSKSAFEEAMKDEGSKEIMSDFPNFSSVPSIKVFGGMVMERKTVE